MNQVFLVASVCATLLGAARLWRSNLQFAVAGGDEDMKIAAPGGFSRQSRGEEASEEAERFLRLKRSGNIDKARSLGEKYAAVLLRQSERLRQQQDQDDPLCLHQRLVLFSYAINRAISDLSPDSILAQTSLNVFYSEVEDGSPELYRHISDMAAFSLYILCERSNIRSEEEIGAIYARLCGNEDDPETVREGNTLYRRFYDYCAKEVGTMDYEPI